MSAKEELIQVIKNMTPEQVKKFAKIVDLVKNMSENQLVFTETFLDRIFGEGTADAV